MAKAKKLPSGNYHIKVFSHTEPKLDKNGKPLRDTAGKPLMRRVYVSFTGPVRREVEYQAAEFRRDKERRRHAYNLTVGEVVDLYIADADGLLSPTTIQSYKRIRRNNFQSLMLMPIKRLSNNMLRQAVNEEAKRPSTRYQKTDPGRKLSPKTISDAYGLIASALHRYAPNINTTVTLPAPRNIIKELLPPDIIMDLVKDTDIELACLLAMWLSFSMSEIRGLTRSKSLSPDGDYITIREVMVDVDGKPVVKNTGKEFYRIRRHHLPKYIKTLIERTDPEEDHLVPMSGQAIYKRFTRLLQQYNLPHMTFHDLRHVNASVMALLRVPDKYAQERGGWATDKTMKRVYQQTFSAEREAVDQIIDSYFESKMQHDMQHEKEKSLINQAFSGGGEES